MSLKIYGVCEKCDKEQLKVKNYVTEHDYLKLKSSHDALLQAAKELLKSMDFGTNNFVKNEEDGGVSIKPDNCKGILEPFFTASDLIAELDRRIKDAANTELNSFVDAYELLRDAIEGVE